MASHTEPSVVIRPANVSDGAPLTTLCAQLGYPTIQESMQRRLEVLLHQVNHMLYVAEWEAIGVVGVIHVYRCVSLATDPYMEIGGFVVQDRYRGCGIGTKLIHQAEQWAHMHGCTSSRFRSRSDRVAAHALYTKLGYQVTKTQLAFQKMLA